MKQENSIIVTDTGKQIEALQKSRLADLVQDKALLSRISEAAVMLLTNEKLRACDEMSILGALYKAATLGFRLEPEFGECYLIPRNMKTGVDAHGKAIWGPVCTFQIGYKGWKAKALESGHISYISGRGVFKEDEFNFEHGTNAFLKHIPAETNSGETTHFYALSRLRDGAILFEVISKQAAEKSRKNSETQFEWLGTGANKQKKYAEKPIGIWAAHYEAMALRVPIKRLCASLPLTAALEAANSADGTVSYLQKDGTLTTISAVDIDNNSEKIEPDAIPVKDAELFLSTKDILESYATTKEVVDFYKTFEKSPNAKSIPFIQMFFENAARSAKDVSDLTAFYNAAIAWKANEILVGILTNRKSELENKKS